MIDERRRAFATVSRLAFGEGNSRLETRNSKRRKRIWGFFSSRLYPWCFR
jgi:hypothetical protein